MTYQVAFNFYAYFSNGFESKVGSFHLTLSQNEEKVDFIQEAKKVYN